MMFLPLVGVLLLAGCARLPEMQVDINDLKQDSYRMKKDVAALQSSMDALKRDMAAFKAQAGSLPAEETVTALRESQADLYAKVSDLLREVQALNGRFDENKHVVDKMLDQLAGEMQLVKTRLDSGGTAADAEAMTEMRSRLERVEADLVFIKGKLAALRGAGREDGLGNTPAAAPSPKDFYNEAYASFQAHRYTEAREKMQAFLEKFPQHAWAGNAQFWIGETFYAQGKYDEAILAYEEVLEKYADSPKVPAAMLKQAYAFLKLPGDKNVKAAKGVLRSLIEKYPKDKTAEAAARKLKELD
jgi:tol-pal system protein YbgF